jgi:arsenate reductase-like glutaredoxin family protein
MAKSIDWLYHRNSCTTCSKAQSYLEPLGIKAKETVIANKVKYGPEEALQLLEGMSKLIAAKGKKLDVIDLKKDAPTEEALLALMIGPTGNLRAPTARVGKTLLIGFSEEAYALVFGAEK